MLSFRVIWRITAGLSLAAQKAAGLAIVGRVSRVRAVERFAVVVAVLPAKDRQWRVGVLAVVLVGASDGRQIL